MSKFWSEITRNIEPYVCGEQPKDKKYIKLNTNENPYPPSKLVVEAIERASDDRLRLYPNPDCDELRDTIAGYYNLKSDQVFIGNGSDEVLAMSFLTFFNKNEEIVFPDISYSFYPVFANLFGLKVRLSNLKDDFSINVDDFLKENGGVILPNPNAPTGRFLDTDYIEEILKFNSEKVVIVDEAYIDFGGKSVVNLIDDYPNLLVVQTLSKSRSLAGMRVGFAMGQKELIDGLNRIKNSFNSYTVDTLAQSAAVSAFKDEKYFKECTDKIIASRKMTSDELEKLGFQVVPSMTNFIFIKHKNKSAEEIFNKLRESGVLVRYFNKPKIDNYLRVSIGSEDEMRVFIEKIKKVI